MARLLSCGFELQSLTANDEVTTITGSPTINTTIKRSGVASMRCNPTAATSFVTIRHPSAGTSVYARFAIYIASLPSAIKTIAQVFENAFGPSVGIRLNTSGGLELWDLSASPTNQIIGAASSNLSTGEWHVVTFFIDTTTASSWPATAAVDGTTFVNTTYTGSTDFGFAHNTFYVGLITSATADLYFDDIGINDSTTTKDNALPDWHAKIVHLQPDSTGDNSGGTYTGAATGWDCLNEVTPDDATTYVALTVINTDILDVNCVSSASAGIGASDTIAFVAVGTVLSATTAAACTVQTRIKSQASGTVVSGTNTTIAVTAWNTHDDTVGSRNYKLISYTDPQAGGAWTPALLDTMQIGIISSDVTPNPLVSTLWALVEYVPAAGSPIPNRLVELNQSVNRASTY